MGFKRWLFSCIYKKKWLVSILLAVNCLTVQAKQICVDFDNTTEPNWSLNNRPQSVDRISSFTLSRDSSRLAISFENGFDVYEAGTLSMPRIAFCRDLACHGVQMMEIVPKRNLLLFVTNLEPNVVKFFNGSAIVKTVTLSTTYLIKSWSASQTMFAVIGQNDKSTCRLYVYNIEVGDKRLDEESACTAAAISDYNELVTSTPSGSESSTVKIRMLGYADAEDVISTIPVDRISDFRFSDDGKMIAVKGFSKATIISTETGKPISGIFNYLNDPPRFTADGKYFTASYMGMYVKIYQVNSPEGAFASMGKGFEDYRGSSIGYSKEFGQPFLAMYTDIATFRAGLFDSEGGTIYQLK